ncbi:lysozyme inhibitor LprI family protein [Pararhodobacter sp. CCB-MM2]|uniref:lysozyme inhibitor LprI family protein n=1 Tax=Pararhodobacter sp. CCB-MM2 TaxID=1786003 RepID=UPI00082B4AE5|nr:lysozyme inhibitor LprI family protein [Pararhodobacter sp. CCB-MM2]
MRRPALPAIILCLVGFVPPAAAASFDCAQTGLAADEQAICDSRSLNDMDVEMATMYRFLRGLFMMGRRGAMADDQRAWLSERQACGADVPCLTEAYRSRIEALQAVYDGIDRPL